MLDSLLQEVAGVRTKILAFILFSLAFILFSNNTVLLPRHFSTSHNETSSSHLKLTGYVFRALNMALYDNTSIKIQILFNSASQTHPTVTSLEENANKTNIKTKVTLNHMIYSPTSD